MVAEPVIVLGCCLGFVLDSSAMGAVSLFQWAYDHLVNCWECKLAKYVIAVQRSKCSFEHKRIPLPFVHVVNNRQEFLKANALIFL